MTGTPTMGTALQSPSFGRAPSFWQMQAAADFLGNGAIEIPIFETEIHDIIRRTSVFLERVDRKPANGHPHRYFEQTAISTATFTDPRNITPTPSGPTRLERSAFIKAITNQTNISLFDVDVTRQQGQFGYVEARECSLPTACGPAAIRL